jgi:O-antigen ligase
MLVFGLLLYAGLLWLKKKGKIVSQSAVTAFIGFLILYGTLTPLIGRLPVVDITSSLGRDSTLTERTINWAALVPSATAKPLLGHGVGGFWTTVRVGRYYFPAHNGYLEVILVLGFIGLLIVSFYLLSSARKAWVLLTGEYDWGVLWICWLAMALLNNITESSLNSFANLLMAVPLWLALSHKVRVGQSP